MFHNYPKDDGAFAYYDTILPSMDACAHGICSKALRAVVSRGSQRSEYCRESLAQIPRSRGAMNVEQPFDGVVRYNTEMCAPMGSGIWAATVMAAHVGVSRR